MTKSVTKVHSLKTLSEKLNVKKSPKASLSQAQGFYVA